MILWSGMICLAKTTKISHLWRSIKTNDMKQTAVEWLINELKKSKHYQQMINEVHQNNTIVSDILEQAKEMEKEQIIEAYEYTAVGTSHYGEQYYNKTFKQ